MNTIHVLLLASCAFLGSSAAEPKSFTFDKVEFAEINKAILLGAKGRGEFDIGKLNAREQAVIKKHGVKKVHVTNPVFPRHVSYTIRTSGIAISGSLWPVEYSEGSLPPTVADVFAAGAKEDGQIVLYQLLAPNWYFRSTTN
jgi:hypothetical protein